MPIVAWYVLSKLSYMNRVMREVFPTAGEIRKQQAQQKLKCTKKYEHKKKRLMTRLLAQEDQLELPQRVGELVRSRHLQAWMNHQTVSDGQR